MVRKCVFCKSSKIIKNGLRKRRVGIKQSFLCLVCKKTDGSERHYGGAFPPMGDINADGILNDIDQSAMVQRINNPSTITLADKQVFDFDGDGDIDMQDLAEFTRGYVGNNAVIPAVSTWGLANLSLLLATAATLVLKGRKLQYSTR